MATVTITQLTDPVTVEETTQSVSVSGATSFPITIEYNATIVEGGGAADNGLPEGGVAGQILTKVDDTDYAAIWADAPQGFSGDYNDLTNTPAIPAATSDLTNDSGFITSSALSGYLQNVVEDTTPTLGGNIDMNGFAFFNGLDNGLKFNVGSGAVVFDMGQTIGNNRITTPSAGQNLILTANNFSGGTITIPGALNGNIVIQPNGSGRVVLDGQSFPAADGQAGQALVTDGAGNLSWQDILTPAPGGSSTGLSSVVQDTTPQLGGDLDVNGFSITNDLTNGNVTITTNGTGRLVVNGLALPNTDGQAGQVLKTDGQGDLYWADDEDTITTVSEAEPQVAVVGEQWFNPTTQILKVYTAAGWVQVTADDLQF